MLNAGLDLAQKQSSLLLSSFSFYGFMEAELHIVKNGPHRYSNLIPPSACPPVSGICREFTEHQGLCFLSSAVSGHTHTHTHVCIDNNRIPFSVTGHCLPALNTCFSLKHLSLSPLRRTSEFNKMFLRSSVKQLHHRHLHPGLCLKTYFNNIINFSVFLFPCVSFSLIFLIFYLI